MPSLCIYSNTSFFPTCKNEKEHFCDLLRTLVSMLGWFLDLKMSFKLRSLTLFEIGSYSVYSGILRLVTAMEKKVFKTWAVSCSVRTTSPLVIKMIVSVDTILSERNSFIVLLFYYQLLFSYLTYCNDFFIFLLSDTQ